MDTESFPSEVIGPQLSLHALSLADTRGNEGTTDVGMAAAGGASSAPVVACVYIKNTISVTLMLSDDINSLLGDHSFDTNTGNDSST